jgi:peptidyl-prolyl cis-trans isomerase C
MSKNEKTAQLETYNLLRASLNLFKKSPNELADGELKQAKIQALNEYKIENKVLNAPEAASVVISGHELQRAYQEIRGRYEDETAFLSDLEINQLNDESLRAALQRQCKVNTVLDIIGSRSPKISDIEVGIYYHLHPEQFQLPERREACHIFISVNPDYPENTSEMALVRAQEIAQRLQKKPHKFAELALKHSECPTALQGGILGTVKRGALYPELDVVLFNLKAGQISNPVQSEIGFHVLLCKSIHRAETLSLAKATPKIRQLMSERAKRICQRAWLASLPSPELRSQQS